MKKNILNFVFAFLGACLLFGCGQEQEESEGNNSMGKESTPTGSGTILGSREDLESNDKENLSEEDKKEQVNYGKIENNEGWNADIEFEFLENYKEKNIPSVYTQDNENEEYSNVLLNENKEIVYYTCADEADGYHIWKYTLKEGITADSLSGNSGSGAGDDALWAYKNTTGWKREPVLWLEGIKEKIIYGRLILFRGEDLNDYAWYMGEGERAYLVKRVGDSNTEIPISDWGITDTDHATVAVLANGDVVMADAGRECFIYNPEDGSLLTSFECGWYESICVRENMIYISARGGASVQRYDAQKQEFLPTIEAGFDKSVRIALQEDDVYVCTPDGIFRAKENFASFQKVMEAGNFHFAKESGVLLKFFVIGDAFYVVYGEEGVSIKKYSLAAPDEEISNSLTVYSLESNDLILDMISEFQGRYPDIELIYETGEGADGSITVSDRIRALNARILAGDGPDVLLLDGLPVDSYMEKGILEDLTSTLDSVKGDLLPNILSAYTVENKIYMLPLRILIPMFMTSGQEAEVYSNLENLVEYSEAEGGAANIGYSYANILQILYLNYSPDILSEDGLANREETAQFLTLVKRFCESEQITEAALGTVPYRKGNNQLPMFLAKGEIDLGFLCVNGGYGFGTAPAAVEARGGELVGNQGIFFPNGLLGSNQLSANRELAQLFIQFAFSYEVQERYVPRSGYQIHTKVLDEFAQLDLSQHMVGDDTTVLRDFTAEESAQMIEVVKKVHTPVTVEESIWEIFSEVAENYLKGINELDESVDELVSRLQLYLYE